MEAESVVGRPAAALAGLVHGYHGYRYVGFRAGTHVGLPSRHATFVLSLADPIDVRGPAGTVVDTAQVGGLHAEPVTIHHDGTQVGVHVSIEPIALPALFGCPAGELTGQVVGLDALLGATATRELEERLRQATSWTQRFAAIDRALLRARRSTPPPSPEVVRAWDVLVRSRGAAPISRVADDVGWSRRHLAERFGREVGLPPKVLARVVRFQVASDLLVRDPTRSLAELAAVAGYSDQPHLNRDFKRLTGLSPTAWLASEELPTAASA